MTAEQDFERALRIDCAPHNSGKTFAVIKCEVDFEPHGRASETWGRVWLLKLPQVPYHWWKRNQGWVVGDAGTKPMSFHGRTLVEVMSKATDFMNKIDVARFHQ